MYKGFCDDLSEIMECQGIGCDQPSWSREKEECKPPWMREGEERECRPPCMKEDGGEDAEGSENREADDQVVPEIFCRLLRCFFDASEEDHYYED